MGYIALQMNLSILDYLSHEHKIDFRNNIQKGKPLYGISEKEMMKVAQMFMEIFKSWSKIGKEKKSHNYCNCEPTNSPLPCLLS